jgi:hypothetical protein
MYGQGSSLLSPGQREANRNRLQPRVCPDSSLVSDHVNECCSSGPAGQRSVKFIENASR